MHAWVTGATGFIGGALVERLLAEGSDVTALVRPGSAPRAAWGARVRIVRGALPLEGDPFAGAARPDVVFHAAADMSADPDRARARRVHVTGTDDVARLALAHGARLVHLSSVSVLGYRDRDAPVDESTRCEPLGVYGETKREAEIALGGWIARGLDAAILRPPIVYGPGSRADHVFHLAARLARGRHVPFGDGRARVSYLFVDHCVDAMLLLATKALGTERTFLVDDGRPLSHRELADEVSRAVGRPVSRLRVPESPMRLAAGVVDAAASVAGIAAGWTYRLAMHTMSFECRIDRIRSIGYAPRVPLPEALARTVAWARAERLF